MEFGAREKELYRKLSEMFALEHFKAKDDYLQCMLKNLKNSRHEGKTATMMLAVPVSFARMLVKARQLLMDLCMTERGLVLANRLTQVSVGEHLCERIFAIREKRDGKRVGYTPVFAFDIVPVDEEEVAVVLDVLMLDSNDEVAFESPEEGDFPIEEILDEATPTPYHEIFTDMRPEGSKVLKFSDVRS